VFNRSAKQLMGAAGALSVVSHDWWAYMMVTGAGGTVYYDRTPSLCYRQHAANVVGSNRGVSAWLKRMRMVVGGRFREWNDINVAALQRAAHLLTQENRNLLKSFIAIRRSTSLREALQEWCRSGFYRQTWRGQLAFIAALIAKKV
jgi:hypothetical protein